MNQGGRKPRPTDGESDDTFDAKTVIRPNPTLASLDDDDDDGAAEKTKLGSPLDQAFGERTMVVPSRAAGNQAQPPQPPQPTPRESRAAPEMRIPQPPPRPKPQPRAEPKPVPLPEPEEQLEISEVTQWNSQISRLDVTNPGLEPIGKRSLKEKFDDLPKNTKIIGGAIAFLLVIFAITRLTGRGGGEADHSADVRPSVETKHGDKPKPAVTPPQQQAMGGDGGVPVESVLQQFDHAFFSIQSQARGQ